MWGSRLRKQKILANITKLSNTTSTSYYEYIIEINGTNICKICGIHEPEESHFTSCNIDKYVSKSSLTNNIESKIVPIPTIKYIDYRENDKVLLSKAKI